MEMSRVLNVSMEEMDRFVFDMILEDIKNSTGKSESKKKIRSGYSYSKNLKGRTGSKSRVKTTIRELTSGKYHVTFKSNQGLNHLIYSYVPEDEESIRLTYSESYEADSKSNGVSYKVMNFVYAWSSKRKIKRIFNSIEHIIQENRELQEV